MCCGAIASGCESAKTNDAGDGARADGMLTGVDDLRSAEGAYQDESASTASAPWQGGAAGGAAGADALSREADAVRSDEPTYHRDVRPILEARCVSCHDGTSIDRPTLTRWAYVEPHAGAIAHAVASGAMPPWQAEPTCHPVTTPTRLYDEDIETITRWYEAGAAEGDPADYVAPPTPEIQTPDLGPPSFSVDIGVDFQVPAELTEITVCFPLDVDTSEGLRVRAVDVRPEVFEIVHHAILRAVDASRPAPSAANGWSCSEQDGRMIGGFLPGTIAAPLPAGAVTELAPSERLVLQLHYHHHPSASEPTPSDRTAVALWTLPASEAPVAYVDYGVIDSSEALFIPAGDPEVEFTMTQAVGARTTLVGVVPHMHHLGARIEAHVVRESGDEQCLVSIPQWEFDRQQLYFFPDPEPVTLEPGDTIRVRCVYDNSPENQPYIGGEWITPRDVHDGWQSTDEMCQLALLTLR